MIETMAARTTPTVRPWIRRLARLGFGARGLVYILVGLLAAGAAAGIGGGKTTDTHGAIGTVGAQPFGAVFLIVLGVGLAAYAVWRFTQAALDLEGKGTDAKGLAVRASYAASGVVHAGMAFTAGSLAVGLGRGHSDPVRGWAGRLMDEPFGRWLVGAIGVAVLGAAAYQLYKAWSDRFEEHLRTQEMSATARRWSKRIGRAGLAARGVTFGIIGWFLVRAALQVDPGQARGLAGALRTLARQDHGRWLLGVVALGLTAYGVLSLINARYRAIKA